MCIRDSISSIIKSCERDSVTKLGLYASMVSVIASVLIYIVLDDSQLAIYVGLWAPTLILYSQAYEQANK